MMKNLGKAELAAIIVTIVCLFFTAGFFVGRSTAAGVVTITNLQASPASAANAPISSDSGVNSLDNDTASSPAAPAVSASDLSAQPEPAEKININSATRAELTELTGIGEVLAQNIIDYRDQIGKFSRIEQLMDVKGIGTKKFDAVKDLITVG